MNAKSILSHISEAIAIYKVNARLVFAMLVVTVPEPMAAAESLVSVNINEKTNAAVRMMKRTKDIDALAMI